MIDNNTYRKSIAEISALVYRLDIMSGANILITGATGLIGSVIVDILLSMNDTFFTQTQVTAFGRNIDHAIERFGSCFTRKDFRFVEGDVNESIPELGNMDFIIHGASNTHPSIYSADPIGTITTNVIGTYHVLEYARMHNPKRFLFMSSVEIYGENRGDTDKFTEDYLGFIDCNTTRAGYPESKRTGESLCCAYLQKHDMDIVIPRLCRIYGPTMMGEDSKATAQFLRNAVNRQDIILKSKGDQYYSFLDVFDAAYGILYLLLKGKKGQVYNISSEYSDVTLCELAKKIAEIGKVRIKQAIPDEAEKSGYSNRKHQVLDNKKLKELGWKELYTLEEGLQATIKILKEIGNK